VVAHAAGSGDGGRCVCGAIRSAVYGAILHQIVQHSLAANGKSNVTHGPTHYRRPVRRHMPRF
jgi:hypothetical protein